MLLIGTCRLKLAASRSPSVRRLTHAIEGHVHYPEEIQQMLRFVSGELEIPEPLLPLINVDVSDAKIDNASDVAVWRNESSQRLQEARTVCLEVSSYKRLPIEFDGQTWFANLNAFSSCVKQKNSKSSFLRDEVTDRFIEVKPQLYDAERFDEQLSRLLDQFGDRRIILVPHFQAVRSDTGLPIENRPQLRDQIRAMAQKRGCEFFDQDLLGTICGPERTRTDSSHYSKLGEQVMATCLLRLADGPLTESQMVEHLREVASRLDQLPLENALEPWTK